MRRYLILFILLSCSSTIKETFKSVKLTSSKGENIYVNSLNWGVTDDSQITVISSSMKRLKNESDTLDIAKGLEPFIYSFKNDSLKLYFNNNVSYKVKESFKTISISYIILNPQEYKNIRQRAYVNDGYYSIPKREKINYPSDMPKGPGR